MHTKKTFSDSKMERLGEQIIDLVRRKKAVFISDIAREFGITVNVASYLVKMLSKDLVVEDKGIAKLVMLKDDAQR